MIGACAAWTVSAQTRGTNAPAQIGAAAATQSGKATATFELQPKAPEIVKGNVVYSGLAVQVVKASNPVQLVNPLAPARYGSAEDNVLRDGLSGRALGLKVFAIRF
jgi:hypothetical protein